MDARLVTNLELAQRDARKTFRISPVLAADEPLYDLDAVQMVVDVKEGFEQKQLTDSVAEVEQFHRQIGCYQVVAVQFTCKNSAHCARKYLYSGVLIFITLGLLHR